MPLVRLTGPIGEFGLRRGLTLARVQPLLEAAFRIKRAVAVALVVDSPGGSPVQSALIAARIRSLAAEHGRPVLGFVEDIAASGGYWLACAADEIFADPSSIVGSVGVVSAGFGFVEALEKLGLERRVHTTGPQKALLDPFRPEKPEDLAVLAEIQDDVLDAFRRHVTERRGAKLKLDASELTTGRVWTGRRALEHGLVDGLGHLDAILRERFGAKVRIRRIERRRSFWRSRLGLDAGAIASEVATAVLDHDIRRRLGAAG